MKRHSNCDVELFHKIVDLRASGHSWLKIARLLNRSHKGAIANAAHSYTRNHIRPSLDVPQWIYPSLPDQIVNALRSGEPPPGTPEQISKITDRATAQGLLP